MKKAAAYILIFLIMCLTLAACGGPVLTAADTEETGAAPTNTPQKPSGDIISFAHADEVYANPDAYSGKTLEGLFQIVSGLQQFENKSAYYAKRLTYTGAPDALYTILSWDSGIPEFTSSDICYIWGTVKGKKTITLNNNPMGALLIDAGGYERDAAKANIVSASLQYTFEDGQYAASSGSLTLNITSLFFSKSDLTVCTKTTDSALGSSQNYHFDIILHQNGIFVWNYDSRFWMGLGSTDNSDYTLFPALDCKKDITAEFAPFDASGKLIFEPLTININLSGLKASGQPTETVAPTETETPTESISPTESVSPIGSTTLTGTPTGDGNGG